MTLRDRFLAIIKENPSIPGIKDDDDFRQVLQLPSKVVFVLYGNVLTIPSMIAKLKAAGKFVLVNVDLIEGFSSKDIVVKYFKEHTQVDGILSSKAAMIKAAKALGLFTIHRFFVIDSFSYHNLSKQVELSKPDCVEIMPGCMPKVISWVLKDIRVPLIAGGLVCDRESAEEALKAGAKAISSTNKVVWGLRFGGSVSRDRPRSTRVLLDKSMSTPSHSE